MGLKLINDHGECLFECNNSGFYGLVNNDFLSDVASGNLLPNEFRVCAYLMSSAGWDNRVDDNVSRGAKLVGITARAYRDIIKRLIEKNIIFENESGTYLNPLVFRRRHMRKVSGKPFKKLEPNDNFDTEDGAE